MKKQVVSALLAEIAREERKFIDSVFLAPIVSGGQVRTRVAGVILTFKIQTDFTGWAICQPLNWQEAKMIEEANFAQIDQYLGFFPKVRMVLSKYQKGYLLGHPAHSEPCNKKFGFKKGEMKPIYLVTGAEQFEQVICRFDGTNLWFEEIEPRRDPQIAENLRQALVQKTLPDQLRISTLTPEEKIAYSFALGVKLEKCRDQIKDQLDKALKHANGSLMSYIDQGQTFLVRYIVDGVQYTSSVAKGSLQVVSAGICLDGYDRNFDLTSLVGVMRESQQRRDEYDW